MKEQASITQTNTQTGYELFLLGLPTIACILIWFWVGDMNLLQKPGNKMTLIMLFTVIGTAIIAAMEADKAGMVSDRKKGSYGPVAWFFIISLMWIIGYPAYLFKRRHYGLNNRLIVGTIVAVSFIGSWVVMNTAIEVKIDEVKQQIEHFGR